MVAKEESEKIDEHCGIETTTQKTHMKYLLSPWYKEIVEYLLTLRCPPSYDKTKYRTLRLRSQKFLVANGHLYWRDPSGILLLYLTENEVEEIMAQFHEGICGGHYSWRTTENKILKDGFFWPKLFGDVFARVRAHEKCQKFAERQKFAPLPMIPVHIEEPFQQWGIDFIGKIHHASSGKHKWILTATEYFTKWVEVVLARSATDTVVIKFLEDNIISIFGCPAKIVIENAQAFKSAKFISFYQQYNIVLGHSNAYYP